MKRPAGISRGAFHLRAFFNHLRKRSADAAKRLQPLLSIAIIAHLRLF